MEALGIIGIEKGVLRLVEETRANGGLVILDIGVGDDAKLSIEPENGDLVVMADPDLRTGTRINKGDNKVDDGVKIVLFPEKVDVLPDGLAPDLIMSVCPIPDQVESILYEMVRLSGQQTRVLMVIEGNTVDGRSYLKENLRLCETILSKARFEVDIFGRDGDSLSEALDELEVDRVGVINSASRLDRDAKIVIASKI